MSALPAKPVASGGWWGLTLLVLIYIENFVDRTILSSLGEPIRHDLGLNDTQLGLLGGLAFALTYSALGVPIALRSERTSRKTIIVIAMLLWSAMTMACSIAGGFVSLLVLRAGVGIGEAGFTPPAHALISDYFPPAKRPLALGLFNAAIPFGVLIAAISGGWLMHHVGWRASFVAVGAPGLLLAALALLTLREPRRGEADTTIVAPSRPRLAEVGRYLWQRSSAIHLILGGSWAVLPGYAMVSFAVSYLIRRHHLDIGTAAMLFGVAVAGGQLFGIVAGGALASRIARNDPRRLLLVPMISTALAGVVLICAWQQSGIAACVGLLALGTFFAFAYLGPYYAALHGLLTPRNRASGMSLVLLVHTLVGLGLGPPLIGWISDRIARGAYGSQYARNCISATGAHAIGNLSPNCLDASAFGIGGALTVAACFSLLAAAQMLLAARRYTTDLNLAD